MQRTSDANITSVPDLERDRSRLAALTVLLFIAGLALAATGGPPRWPAAVPDAHQLLAVLSGSALPLGAVGLAAVDLAWMLWVWIAGSLCLELLVLGVENVARGAAWVASLRAVTDRVTPPLVRRAVAAAFAVQVLSRGVPVAAAQSAPPTEIAVVSQVADAPSAVAQPVGREAAAATHTVVSGDTLWSIAERAYGSGAAYRRIVAANVGRRMVDGQVFSPQGVIRPGWELLVPDRSSSVEVRDGEQWYMVQDGDSLSAIARDLLGSGSDWQELFDLNRGAATPDGSHTMSDPDVIWPGTRLRLPQREVTLPATADVEQQSLPDDSTSTDMVVAAVPSAAAPTPVDADLTPAEQSSELPPLLRSPHALDPVALEPTDSVAASSADAGGGAASGDAGLAVNQPRPDLPGPAPLAAGGLGIAAIAGIALGVRRMRRLRPLLQQAESDVVVQGGFAEAELAQNLTRAVHGAGFDPVAALVGHLYQFLREYNLNDVGVLSASHGRSGTTLTLTAGIAEQRILLDLAPVFAARLEAEVEACISTDNDVVFRFLRARKSRLLPVGNTLPSDVPVLLPLGVLYDHQLFSAAWNALGHVLVASSPGHGADTILTSLLAALTAHRSPEDMQVWLFSNPRELPAPVFDFPHVVRCVDPADAPATAQAIQDLRLQLDEHHAEDRAPELVVVVPELAELTEYSTRLERLVGTTGPACLRLVAATAAPEQVMPSPLLPHFSTRMVLRMADEQASVAMLGQIDAAYIGGGGRLLLRLDGRRAIELYGYQIAPEHLERLLRAMRSTHPRAAAPDDVYDEPALPPTTPDEPRAEADTTTPTISSAPATVADAETERAGDSPDSSKSRSAIALSIDTPKQAPIEIVCFGGPRIVCAGQLLWPRLSSGEMKPWELLLYLACQPEEGVSTGEAIEALWPDDDQADDPAHRFRQLRYRLRRALADVPGAPITEGIFLERGSLRLDPAVVRSDAQEFLTLVRTARSNPDASAATDLERARALYTADLMQGPDAQRYAWLVERGASGVTLREHFRRLFEQASLRLAEIYAAGPDLRRSIALYQELTDIDPGDETLWCALFRLHAERGDRLGLIREERRMRDALRELSAELEDAPIPLLGEPSRDTLDEYERLLQALRDREPQAATA